MGLIDGAAPPFIMLVLAAAIMAALLTFASYAASRTHLRVQTQNWLIGYSLAAVILAALVIIRITARGMLQAVAAGFDSLILVFTAGILSAFGVLSLFAWRYSQESAS